MEPRWSSRLHDGFTRWRPRFELCLGYPTMYDHLKSGLCMNTFARDTIIFVPVWLCQRQQKVEGWSRVQSCLHHKQGRLSGPNSFWDYVLSGFPLCETHSLKAGSEWSFLLYVSYPVWESNPGCRDGNPAHNPLDCPDSLFCLWFIVTVDSSFFMLSTCLFQRNCAWISQKVTDSFFLNQMIKRINICKDWFRRNFSSSIDLTSQDFFARNFPKGRN